MVLFGLIVVAVMCILLRNHEREQREERSKPACDMKNVLQELGTKDLFLRTLTEMGCQYEIDEDDDGRKTCLCTLTEMCCPFGRYKINEVDVERIMFGYQGIKFDYRGEMFKATVSNYSPYVWIRLPFMRMDRGDFKRMLLLIMYVKPNDANLKAGVTIDYMLDDDKKHNVYLKSNFSFLFTEPNPVEFLRARLDTFFKTKHFLQVEMEKLQQKEERQKKRQEKLRQKEGVE